MTRLLVPHAAEGTVVVEGLRRHHLVTVLRLREGDALEVFDGRGTRFDATVTALSPTQATLALSNARAMPPARAFTVVQGLPKADKLELVLQKGTELGAAAFAPAACARSVVKLDAPAKEQVKRDRWQRIVEEAARQCGRADVPRVLPVRPLEAAVAALDDSPAVFVLDEAERALPLSVAAREALEARRPVALVVGPEGGLSREEVAALAARGAVPVTLGPLILRTETAALAALAVLRHLDGDLG